MVVDNLMFMARNRIEAEHKVKQIYRRCEIFDCHELRQIVKKEDFDRESAINPISKKSAPELPANDAKTLGRRIPQSLLVMADNGPSEGVQPRYSALLCDKI